jgi:hypothetical protein
LNNGWNPSSAIKNAEKLWSTTASTDAEGNFILPLITGTLGEKIKIQHPFKNSVADPLEIRLPWSSEAVLAALDFIWKNSTRGCFTEEKPARNPQPIPRP